MTRSSTTLAIAVAFLTLGLSACGGGSGGGADDPPQRRDPPPPPPPPPADPNGFGGTIAADLGIFLRTSQSGSFFSPLINDTVNSSTRQVIRVDWQSGAADVFASASVIGSTGNDLEMLTADDRFFSTSEGSVVFTLRELEPRSGTEIGRVEVIDPINQCKVVVGQTLYYESFTGSQGSFRKVDDFANSPPVQNGDVIANSTPCGRETRNVSGEIYTLDYTLNVSGPSTDPIEVWRIDPATGLRDTLITSLDNSDERFVETVGFGLFRIATFALANDGIYIADIVVEPITGNRMDYYFAPYLPPASGATTITPTLIGSVVPADFGSDLDGFTMTSASPVASDDGYAAQVFSFERLDNGVLVFEYRMLVADTASLEVDIVDIGFPAYDIELIHYD